MKVLIVEDDQDLAKVLSATLTQNNCVVDIATNGEMGLDMVDQWEYDVILLDVMLPRLDGMAVCRQLRQQGCATAILMLTAQSSTADVVTGLDAGADDYVTKPFDPQQVLARLRALQRRQTPAVATMALSWGDLVFDTRLTYVTYNQQEIALSPKEYALLELFLRNPKRVFSRRVIIDKLWTIDEAPSEPTVTNLVKDLRRKLNRAGMPYDPIETLHGLGYRLKSPPATIAEPLSPTPSPPPPQPPSQQLTRNHDLSPTMEEITNQFQARLQTRLADLYAVEAALRQGQLTADQQQQAQTTAHKLTGSLGVFGYSQGSDLMRAIEHLLMAPFPLHPEQVQRLTGLLAALKPILAQPPSFETTPIPWEVTQQILIIDADASFTADLAPVTADLPFTLTIAPDHPTAYHRLADHSPDVVVINLGATAPQAETLTFLADLNTDFPGIPVLVLADQDNLETRTAVVDYRVQRFIAKPVKPMELLAIITQVLAETHSNTATAMIVDDDPLILRSLSGLLLAQGIQATCLLNPDQFWDLAKVVNPALLLLDLEMPNTNGIELCKTVRQDAKYKDLPILIITAHTDTESVHRAFAAGADDVLPKPVPEPLLLTRINQYLTRRHH